jgi:hypothetical protein
MQIEKSVTIKILFVIAVLIWIVFFGLLAGNVHADVPSSTQLVSLHRTTPVHMRPGSPVSGAIKDTEPDTGEPTVMPIITERDVDHHDWLRVRLPYRPDGSTGWISTISTTLSTTPWAVYVNRAERKARIFEHGKLKHTYPVIVGRPSLPTPAGSFFVTEIMEDKGEVTGPYALATSDFSNVLQEFDGGPGQIALHGREGLPEPISTASSHGCVRFANQDIEWMANHVTQGTPITIT